MSGILNLNHLNEIDSETSLENSVLHAAVQRKSSAEAQIKLKLQTLRSRIGEESKKQQSEISKLDEEILLLNSKHSDASKELQTLEQAVRRKRDQLMASEKEKRRLQQQMRK
mmetsp:Transcript_40401/g.63068  ORF Transcript_40401/g.63068 Transcript_40401/m.63068 type:complete len:112 (+) Transcript_40401:107-442(+)